jgi:hypothetical protein
MIKRKKRGGNPARHPVVQCPGDTSWTGDALGVSQVVDVFRALTTAAVALANAAKMVMVRTVPRHSRVRKGTPLHTAVHQT